MIDPFFSETDETGCRTDTQGEMIMSKYRIGRRRAGAVRDALEFWKEEGMLTREQHDALRDSIEVEFDWARLAFHATWIAAVCMFTGMVALLASDIIVALLENAPAALRALGSFVAAGLLVFFGFRLRLREHPHIKTYGVLLFLGCVFISLGFSQVAVALDLNDASVHLIFLPACMIYGLIGWYGRSGLSWLFALMAFSSWLGVRTGYSWGGYWLMDSQPLQSMVYGALLTGLSLLPYSAELLKSREIHGVTQVWGLLALFIPLWILSIWGAGEHKAQAGELIAWSLIMAAAGAGALLGGLRLESGRLVGFGLTFLGIELYTKYFEYCWDHLNQGLFFMILGGSLILMVKLIQKYRIENRNATLPEEAA